MSFKFATRISQRSSIIARVKRQSVLTRTQTTDTFKSASLSTMMEKSPQHFNDWPNAIGFDTVYAEHEPIEVPVKGHIPAYAAGTLFRTGIGPRYVRNGKGKTVFTTNHWFDAFSQVHRFQLHSPNKTDSGSGIERVTYNSRLSSDALIDRIQKTGEMREFTFAAKYEPCRSFFQKVQSVFEKAPELQPNEMNNAVTISVNYPGFTVTGASQQSPQPDASIATLCNKTDASRLQFLDPETLKPTGVAMQTNLHPQLKGPLSAAHPETDPVTGDVYNYNLDFSGRLATYRVFRISASTGKTTILTTFNHAGTYVHSLFLTERFVVLCLWNSYFSMAGVSLLWKRNVLDAMYFEDKSPATWLVIDRRCPETEGGKGIVAKFKSDPFFAFHSVNAYETPSQDQPDKVDLVCDICVYNDSSVMHQFWMDQLQSSHPESHERSRKLAQGQYENAKAHIRRYRLPSVGVADAPDATTIKDAIVDFTASASQSLELPTIHPSYATKPHRYAYGIVGSDGTKSTFVDALLKYDFETHETVKWEEKGHTPGEAIFVPAPGEGKAEDEGVLLSVVLNGYTGKSYLLCLDAKDLKEMGRVEVDGAIGFGFHGVFSKL